MTRHRLLLALLVGVLATGATVTVWVGAGAGTDHCARVARAAAERAALVTGDGLDVLVIGDSYSVGAGVPPRRSWPVRLDGRVRVDGFSGSGFSRGASACGDVSFATRAPVSVRPGTDLVVVEGGLNDTDQPPADLEAGFAELLRGLQRAGVSADRVVVVGPPAAPARRPARVAAVDRALARLAGAAGVAYLSMRGVELTYLDDRLHPDAAGHEVFGDVVAEHVGRHLADVSASRAPGRRGAARSR
ncbi:SGNH/GDSL hydrolase family protein [Nocardioides sp. SYSU DS0651]|uniref:SGNH/GDSL hydrolase family protein n=1 Tax=Nocardioides sp. SYSU DS0651 TaxID=3415955 RepID=UPI003F4BA161